MNLKQIIGISILGLSIVILFFLTKTEPEAIIGQPFAFTPKPVPADNPSDYRKYLKDKNADNPDLYFEIDRLRKTPTDLTNPEYPDNYRFQELSQQNKNRRSVRTANVAWTSRGPANVPGRTRSIVVLEEDATERSWLAGAVSGGIWFTNDAGQSWTNRTPDLPNLITTSIVRSESNPDVFYIGTGENFANPGSTSGSNGNGLFKSIDGGNSFQQLETTANDPRFTNINRIIISPEDPNLLLVCSIGFNASGVFEDDTSYILRSTDGGENWTEVFDSKNEIQQIIASPDDFNIQFATLNSKGIYKSIDAGLSWTFSSSGLATSGRIEMDISPVITDHIFAYTQGGSNGTDADLYVSRDGGASWILTREENGQNNIDNLLQGNYDNVVLAHPFDANTVYMGGVDLFKAVVSDDFIDQTNITVTVEEIDTDSFLSFVRFGGSFLNGGGDIGSADELVKVEIRFGQGVGQNAHRFTVPANSGSNGNGTSGVPPADYTYQDYVNVPFEAWDVSVSPERQLMISFRDQERNGEFNLTPQNDPVSGREYIYIHNLDYNVSAPNTSVATNGGHEFEEMYFLWPISSTSSEITVFPESRLEITPASTAILERATKNLSNARGSFPTNPVNGFNQSRQFGTTSQQGDLHPDHHFLRAVNLNPNDGSFRLLNGNDGGVYLTEPSALPGEVDGSWIFSGQGYNTGQFYGAVKQPGADVYAGGLQDNGSWTSQIGESANENSDYLRSGFGDGFEAVWNASNPDLLIVSSQFNNFFGSRNAGQGDFNQTYSADFGLTDNGSGLGPFVTRIASSNKNPGMLYTVGASGVWRNTNFGLTQWRLTPINPQQWGFTNIADIEVSLADPSIVWAGGRMDAFGRIFVSTDAGDSFEGTTNYTTTPLGFTSGVFTHPTEANTAYTLFSFADRPKVLRTTDLGENWEDISGFEGGSGTSTNGFPDVAVYCLLVLPNDLNTIWVGTEIGIVESNDNGATWHLLDSDLPSVPVWQMQVAEDQVILASHGRGIWTTQLENLPPVNVIPNILSAAQTPTGGLAFVVQLSELYENLELIIEGGNPIPLQSPTTTGSFIFNVDINIASQESDRSELILRADLSENPVESIPFMVDVFPNTVVDEYANDFNNTDLEDFILSGFDNNEEAGFNDGILSSPNPYLAFTEVTAQLKNTIRVGSPNASASIFDNVAIVESGTNSGDFVVVEGSTDGINWEPLLDSYNADENSAWRTKEQNGTDGSSSDFVETSFRITDTFESGELIFIRFRLFSDFNQEFWGWAIDNLEIQTNNANGSVTSIEDDANTIPLSVYPNPVVNKKVEGTFFLPKAEKVVVKVVDAGGRVIQSESIEGNSGSNRLELDMGMHKAGVYILEIVTTSDTYTQRVVLPE